MIDPTALSDPSLLPAILVAAAGGVLSFLSPCVLPIVPPYLAYMGGVSVTDLGAQRGARARALLAAAFFVLGLSTVFLLLGLAASALGRSILAWQGVYIPVAGGLIMLFGLHFLGILRIPFLMREFRVEAGDHGGSAFGAYVLGLAFALGWTPCLGPVLGALLTMASTEADIGRGAILLGVYAAGLGLPFLLVAAFFPSLAGPMAVLRRHTGLVERISGLLLWTIGLFMMTGQFADFSFWLLETVPGLASFG